MEEFRKWVNEEAKNVDLSLMKWQDYIVDMLHTDYSDEIKLEGFHSKGYPVINEISFNFIKPTEPTKKYSLIIERGLQDWHIKLSDDKGMLADGSPKRLFGEGASIQNHKDLYGAIESLLTEYIIPNVSEAYPSSTDTSMAQQTADDQQNTQTDMRTAPLKKDIQIIDDKLGKLSKEEEKLKNKLAVLTKQSAPLKVKRQKDLDQIQNMEKGMATEESSNAIEESRMPPGFSSKDVETIDAFLRDELGDDIKEAEDLPDAPASDVDIDAIRHRLMTQKKNAPMRASKEEPILHRNSIINKKTGEAIPNEILKREMTKRPPEILSRNSKILHSGKGTYVFYNISMPAYKGLYFDEAQDKFKVINTCPSAGACKVYCYAQQGGFVQYEPVAMKLSRILTFLMNHWDEFKYTVVSDIERAAKNAKKKGYKMVLRWHDSGDVFSEKYLDLVYDIARATPEVIHYAYTKRVGLTTAKQSTKPTNLLFTLSQGGLEDKSINIAQQKHATVVPMNYITPYIAIRMGKKYGTKGYLDKMYYFRSEVKKEEFKDRMCKAYHLEPGSVVTYKELMKIPHALGTDAEAKWNVIVGPGDGDDAAMRHDVKGVYLIYHGKAKETSLEK